MDQMSWVTSWEAWRAALGPKRSRQRARVDDYLRTHPAILYWGDSWFSTPLYLNLARQSARRIDGIGMLIGKPGAKAADLFSPAEVARIGARIEASPFDVLCLSAGGNDCLDQRLARVFAAWQRPPGRPKLSPDAAFDALVRDGAFEDVLAAYERLFARLDEIKRARPQFRVIGHPYVPIERIGQPADLTVANIGLIAWLKDDVGPWLWNRMAPVLEEKAAGKAFARRMLVDGFGVSVLGTLAKRHPDLFSVADFSAVTASAQASFWNDEIHPTEAGFAALADPFNAELRARLPAAKRAAVR